MTKFSPSEAALEGFRLTREHPRTILAWAGIYFLGMIALAMLMAVSLGPDFVSLLQRTGGTFGEDDLDAVGGMLAGAWPAFLLVLICAVLLMSVLTAGIYRVILHPGEGRLARLRFGREEFRLTTLNLVLFGLGVVCLFIALLVTAVLRDVAPILGVLGGVAAVCASVWIGVRLCLATPLTFQTGRVSLREAWALTNGRFWPLLGMIVLAVVFYVMIWLLISVIGFTVVTLAGGQPNLAQAMSPAAIVAALATVVMQLVLSVLQLVMIYAPFGVAYQQIAGADPAH